MRRVPLRAIGERLLEVVTTNAATFSSELKRVQIGSRFAFAKTAGQLLGCLPAVVATLGEVVLNNNPVVKQFLEQEVPWDLNLLVAIPETGDADLAFLSDQEKLAELFSGDDYYALTGEPLLEIVEVTPTGVFQHNDFQELDEPLAIAWARVRVVVRLNSWNQNG